MVDRVTGTAVEFVGKCDYFAQNTIRDPGQMLVDKRDKSQLHVTDSETSIVHTVDISTGNVGTFAQSSSKLNAHHITQNQNGNVYVTSGQEVYKISYDSRSISAVWKSSAYRISDITFVTEQSFIVIEPNCFVLRLVDLAANNSTVLGEISTLCACKVNTKKCWKCMANSLLLADNTLYVAFLRSIEKYTCKCIVYNVNY